MLTQRNAAEHGLGSSRSAKRVSKNDQTFARKAPGTRVGAIEDWRAAGTKTREKLNRNGYRDGR